MAVFGRRKKGADAAKDAATSEEVEPTTTADDASTDVDDLDAGDLDADAVDLDEPSAEDDEAARRRRSKLRPREEVDLSDGPYDSASAPTRDEMDFGSLRLVPTEDIELRLDVDETSQTLTGMTAVFGEAGTSAVQLQVFAAPKTTGVWYGIRREIAEAIVAGGGTAEEVDGPLGTELHVRMPGQGPDGRTTFSPARFVGVDGPRWFLRAVLSGDAATDDDAAARAMEFVRTVVVHRGSDPRAPRELLELTLPPELMAQAQASAQEHEQHTDAPTVGPLERGPEIAETR
ncbi:DUF3710 domain-containing protein [Dermacoccus sp. Ellin185]|uniref:DUF3710 domain-containing protein n=1 Tax=Dermacoccus sp. Ellin185 TaxID=188626 RepID=UPI0001E63DD4|nr:DUF3710 domain-containing protein [Dermacoccus sp. Ellin185]EFP58191.1 hypothetical protein HMPREF0321_0117 [Dermacoccus sp. Ellin185]